MVVIEGDAEALQVDPNGAIEQRIMEAIVRLYHAQCNLIPWVSFRVRIQQLTALCIPDPERLPPERLLRAIKMLLSHVHVGCEYDDTHLHVLNRIPDVVADVNLREIALFWFACKGRKRTRPESPTPPNA